MAKVWQPLMSEKASGKIGNILYFKCGKHATIPSNKIAKPATAKQAVQRLQFAEASDAWKSDVPKNIQTKWQELADFSRRFDTNPYYLSGDFWLEWKIGEKNFNQCITANYYNGYQYFLSAFMRWGKNGWSGYPYPPAIKYTV
jgi:uncharacterized protein (DUF2147 family)